LAPFDDLPDCKHVHYSLQLSIYRYIYEKHTKEELGDGYLAHLRNDGTYCLHRSLDLRDRIESWFNGRSAREICGDPVAERKAIKLITSFENFLPFSDKISKNSQKSLMDIIKKFFGKIKN